jgi:RNA polymerase sigma factor (sigma-70 family)
VSPPSTDAESWTAALAGDSAAFADIFDRHADRVLQHAVRLVPSAEDAKDVVGIAFLQAWRKRRQVRFVDGSLLPWLLVTATHTARNISRAQRRYQRVLERIPPSPDGDDPADLVEGGGPAVEALRQLSGKHQEVIALCVLQGFSTGEAAAALGVAEGTVKSRLHWAKRRLADRFASDLVERTA